MFVVCIYDWKQLGSYISILIEFTFYLLFNRTSRFYSYTVNDSSGDSLFAKILNNPI